MTASKETTKRRKRKEVAKRRKHKRTIRRAWCPGSGWYPLAGVNYHVPDAIVCLDCDHWLSLGPANDSDERVRIEKRAALIAIEIAEMTEWWLFFNGSPAELNGYQYYSRPLRNGSMADLNAGYLARCIATHDQEEG